LAFHRDDIALPHREEARTAVGGSAVETFLHRDAEDREAVKCAIHFMRMVTHGTIDVAVE
jgi:hypothetical protein